MLLYIATAGVILGCISLFLFWYGGGSFKDVAKAIWEDTKTN